jgi:lipid-A-disaccharide synthase
MGASDFSGGEVRKVFIMAGEPSGDVLGAGIMRAAKNVKFVGIGGSSMAAAGLKSLFPISDLSVMGVVEVLVKSRTLLRRVREAADAIIREKPDIVLSIDSSSFMTRVARLARKSAPEQMPEFYHVVAPMVWAWGAGRARKYGKIWDRLFCFFDFEAPYFEKYGLKTTVIGYPVYDMVRKYERLENPKLVALLPGSRKGEAARLMPLYKQFAEAHPEYDYALPVAETVRDLVAAGANAWSKKPRLVPFGKRYGLYGAAHFAIAASGTAAAELAIMRVPTVVVYRANWLTTLLSKLLLRTKYISLVNILSGRGIFPELTGGRANLKNVDAAARSMDFGKVVRELKLADKFWHRGRENPFAIVARAVST